MIVWWFKDKTSVSDDCVVVSGQNKCEWWLCVGLRTKQVWVMIVCWFKDKTSVSDDCVLV